MRRWVRFFISAVICKQKNLHEINVMQYFQNQECYEVL